MRGRRYIELRRFLKNYDADCLVVEFGTLAGVVSRAAKALQLPFFIYFRGYDATRALNRWSVRHSTRRSVEGAAGIFAVSNYLVEKLDSHGICHPNTHVLPSGVDTGLFVPGQKEPGRLLYVGRFVDKKSPLLVIRAFARVLRQYPEAHLDMIGAGPLMPAAVQLLAELGLEASVTLHGPQPHEVVREKMAVAGILIQHSVVAQSGDAEGLPSAIQEAMSSGCAVVATRHAGIPEIVTHEENGLLVDELDLEGFADSMSRLLADPAEQARFGVNNRRLAEQRLDCWKIMSTLEEQIRTAVVTERRCRRRCNTLI